MLPAVTAWLPDAVVNVDEEGATVNTTLSVVVNEPLKTVVGFIVSSWSLSGCEYVILRIVLPTESKVSFFDSTLPHFPLSSWINEP